MRRNVAGQSFTFTLVSRADGTAVTTGTPTGVRTLDGTQAACAGTFLHKGSGQWSYAPTQAETNAISAGFLLLHTDAIPVNAQFFPEAYSADGFLSVNVEEIDSTDTDPPVEDAPATAADLAEVETQVGAVSTAVTAVNTKIDSILSAIGRSQRPGTVVSGGNGTTTLAVSGLGLAAANAKGKICEVFADDAAKFSAWLLIADAEASGGNLLLTFATPGFASSISAGYKVIVS